MDRTQVRLGIVLLGLGLLMLLGSMLFDAGTLETAFAVVVSTVAAGALLIGLAHSQQSERVRSRT